MTLGRQRPLTGRLFPQPLPQPVRPVQEVLRAQLAEVPPRSGRIDAVLVSSLGEIRGGRCGPVSPISP